MGQLRFLRGAIWDGEWLEGRHAGLVTPMTGDIPRMRQERGWGEGEHVGP